MLMMPRKEAGGEIVHKYRVTPVGGTFEFCKVAKEGEFFLK